MSKRIENIGSSILYKSAFVEIYLFSPDSKRFIYLHVYAFIACSVLQVVYKVKKLYSCNQQIDFDL